MKKITKNDKFFNKFVNQIKQDFVEWIVGIQEDDPIFGEAKYVYFVVDFSQNNIQISYSADERIFTIFDYGSYFPLEAQNFDSFALKNLSVELFDKKNISKKLVFDMLKNVCLTSRRIDFLKNKNIFFGERFDFVK